MTNRAQDVENIKKEIENGLIDIQNFINTKKNQSSDISFIAELFIEELLNEIYKTKNYNFINLNFQENNYPAIDIADEENGISYQVTVTNDPSNLKSKVKETLTSFYKRRLNTKYKKLYIVVASGIQDKNKKIQVKNITIDDSPVSIHPELFNSENIIDLTDLNKTIAKVCGYNERIRDVIHKVGKRPIRNVYSFPFKHKYIDRTYTYFKSRYSNLEEFIQINKRVILLGVGGLGKSTEIKKIANKISTEKFNYCFRVELIDYANTLIELLDAHCKNWKNVPSSVDTYFLLDGLDEVEGEKINTVSKEIKLFAKQHPNFKILVSCRNNFNPFDFSNDPEDDEKSEEFKGCILNEITENDVLTFINNEANDSSQLKEKITGSNLADLVKNPFYLSNIIDIYNSEGVLPKDKNEFFKQLIEKRIKGEFKKSPHFKMTINEYEMRAGIELLAFTMQYSGRFKITNYEFCQIIRSQNIQVSIKRLFFNEEEENWRFEHNNFQEFLAAKFISTQDFNIIKKVLFNDRNKLRPNWLNAFSFLINLIVPSHTLVSYIVENDIESLLKVEPLLLDKKLINQLFIKIFNKHKAEGTTIWGVKYSTKEVAKFSSLQLNNHLITFLLNEIEELNSEIHSIANAIHILKEILIPKSFKNRVVKIYLSLLEKPEYHYYAISRAILESFSKWKIFDSDIKDVLISNENLFDKEAPLSTFCYFLKDANYEDLTGEILYKLFCAFQEHRVVLSEYSFFELIQTLSLKELIIFIQKITPTDHHDRYKIWTKELHIKIVDHGTNLFNGDKNLIESICNFIYKSVEFNNKHFADVYKSFFIKHNLVLDTFIKCIQQDLKEEKSRRREYFVVPALIADDTCITWLSKFFIDNPWNDNMVHNLIFSFNWVKNFDLINLFLDNIRGVTSGKFDPKPYLWKDYHNRKEKLWNQTILDRNLALSLIYHTFNFLGSDEIDREALSRKEIELEDRHNDIKLAVGIELVDYFRIELIKKDEIIKRYLNEATWERIQLLKHQELVNKGEVPYSNKKWIENWCYKILPEIDFDNAVTKNENGGFTYTYNSSFFTQFMMYLNLKFDKEVLLKMTKVLGVFNYYDRNTKSECRLFTFLNSHLDTKVLMDKIVYDLKERTATNTVLNAQIQAIEDTNWKVGADVLDKYINDSKIDNFERDKALRVYKKLGGEASKLVDSLQKLTFQGEHNFFDWNLLEFLAESKIPECIYFLKKNIDKDFIPNLKIGIYLLIAEDESAFNILTGALELHNNFADNELITNKIKEVNIINYSSDKVINFFNKVLEIYILKDWGSGDFNFILPTLFDKYYELTTFISFEISIIERIEELLNYLPMNETNKRARYRLYELQNKIDINLDREFSIDKAMSNLKTLGIQFEF